MDTYSILHKIVKGSFSIAYKQIKYVNLDKIPKDGAIIFAPNHTSALMDALAILSLSKKPISFVARADIFKNKHLAKILTYLRLIPIMRIRDGYDQLKKNDKTIQKSVEILESGIPLNVFPEGAHKDKHSLMRLLKGIFRIAIKAQVELGNKMPVYIVPVSITYGNFYKYRSSLRAEILDPINIKDYIAKLDQDPLSPKSMNTLKDLLYDRMKEGLLYIENDEYYDAKYDLCALMVEDKKLSYADLFKKNKESLAKLEKRSDIFLNAKEFSELRKNSGISLKSIIRNNGIISIITKCLLLIISLPYAIFANIINSPISILTKLAIKALKNDRVFNNSIRFVLNLILWPIIVIICSAILFAILHWGIALALSIIMVIPANQFALFYNRQLRLTISDIKYISNKKLRNIVSSLKSNIYENSSFSRIV